MLWKISQVYIKPCNATKSIELSLLKNTVALMLRELCDAYGTLGVMPWDSRSDSYEYLLLFLLVSNFLPQKSKNINIKNLFF